MALRMVAFANGYSPSDKSESGSKNAVPENFCNAPKGNSETLLLNPACIGKKSFSSYDSASEGRVYEYTPFGTWSVYNATGSVLAETAYGNPYGFTGRRWDPESDLWYYRNRCYSAELGRFLSRDPAGFVDGSNLYAYVTNNPMRWVDPLGLKREPLTWTSFWGSFFESLAYDGSDGSQVITTFGYDDGFWINNTVAVPAEKYGLRYSHELHTPGAESLNAFAAGLETGVVATTNGVYIGAAELGTLGFYDATPSSWRPISIENYMNQPGYFQAEGLASATVQVGAAFGSGILAQTGSLIGKGAICI